MFETYQSFGSLLDANKMQIGQQSFQHPWENSSSFEYFCFLIFLLDLSESWNGPTNKEMRDTEVWEENQASSFNLRLIVLGVSQEFEKKNS